MQKARSRDREGVGHETKTGECGQTGHTGWHWPAGKMLLQNLCSLSMVIVHTNVE